MLYINRKNLQRITRDRMPGDQLAVDETCGDVTQEGWAFRSRSGKALCITHPFLSGADARHRGPHF